MNAMKENSMSDPVTIDAVAAEVARAVGGGFNLLGDSEAREVARALAEAGWLRTAEDRAAALDQLKEGKR